MNNALTTLALGRIEAIQKQRQREELIAFYDSLPDDPPEDNVQKEVERLERIFNTKKGEKKNGRKNKKINSN